MRYTAVISILVSFGWVVGLAFAGFMPGYPRFKPASISQTTAIVQIRVNPTESPVPMAVGCGLTTSSGPFPFVAPNPSEILLWQEYIPGRILYATSANVSDPNDMLELTVMIAPSEHTERDFELFCALNTMTSSAAVAATHLHLQLLTLDGTFPVYFLPNDLYNYRNPEAFFSFEGDTFGDTIVMKSNTSAPRLALFDVPLRTVHQEEVSFSVSIFQTTISSQVFVGFTDGTTVWGAAVSDRSCEFVMIDYTNPLAYAVGSSLNQFNIFSFVDNNERFNVSFTLSRQTRVVSASFRRGSAAVTRTPNVDLQRSRFPAGPLRLVLFSLAATSTFRYYSINATVSCVDDPGITTAVTDLYAVDILNQLDEAVSASYTMSGTSAIVLSGTTRYQRMLSLPLNYVAKLTDTFALTITYRGVSSLTPASDVFVGITNNTQSWMGARFSNVQQGYLANFSTPAAKISNTPFIIGVAQPVSIDYSVPFDVDLYSKACASCTSAGDLTGVVRTWNGWVTWQVPIATYPVVGPLSLLTLKPTATPSTDTLSFIRLQLSATDQVPPYVVLFSRTKFLRCNHTEVFIAVFNEPVTGFTASSLILNNAGVSVPPYPVDPGHPIEWNFRIQPVNDDYFSVAIAANSFEDLNGWRNPEGSEYLWYLYDSTLPVVVSVIPSIPIQPYINDVTMNNTVFTVTFGEAPFTAFTASRIECVNCVARNVVQMSPTVYTFRLTVIQDSSYTAVRLPWASITDDAGNGNLATSWISWLYDGIFPTGSISAPLPQFVNRTVAQSTRFTVTFSKIVVGFDATKISVTNGYAMNVRQLSATPIQFDFLVVINSGFHDGVVNVSIPYGSVSDRALNPNIATWVLFTLDDTLPKVSLSSSERFPTNSTSVRFIANFTEAMVAANNSNFLVSPGYANNSMLIANSSYRLGPFVVAFDVIPTAQGVISVSVPGNNVTDLGFNPNIASTCGATTGPCTFLFDSVRPTATITTSTLSITNTLLPYNVTFSEFVQYFNTSNINVFGGAPTNVRKSYGNSYLFDVVPNVTDADIFVNLSAFATVDIAYNGLIRTSTVVRHYDVIRPFATVLSDMPAEVSQYTNVPFLIQFSEYIQEDAFVDDFSTRNINLTVFELYAPANATSGPVYKLFMRPIYDDCDMGLYMPANIYHDRAGNGNRDLYYGIHYQLSYNPGWPLWAKIMVVLGPLTCCISSAAIACYCWLRLPPLKKIPDEEVEPFDAAKAIADMKAAAAAEEEKLRRVRLGLDAHPVEEVKVLLESPLPPSVTPRTGGFAVQLMGTRKSEIDRYTPQPTIAYTTASPQLEFDTPSPFRSASPGAATLSRKKSSFRNDVVFPAEDFHGGSRLNLVSSPLAWEEQKASPTHVTLVSPGKKKSYYPASRTGVL